MKRKQLARTTGLFYGGRMKPPFIYHSKTFQELLLKNGTREQLLAWLTWNDPNGTYSDQGSIDEGWSPLTLEEAREIMARQSEESRAEGRG